MKTTLISGLVLSALLATAPAFAQSAYGGKTRAEVKAELASARRAGNLDAVNSLSYPATVSGTPCAASSRCAHQPAVRRIN